MKLTSHYKSLVFIGGSALTVLALSVLSSLKRTEALSISGNPYQFEEHCTPVSARNLRVGTPLYDEGCMTQVATIKLYLHHDRQVILNRTDRDEVFGPAENLQDFLSPDDEPSFFVKRVH